MGNANGAFVNDQRFEERRRLENRDEARLGPVTLVVAKIFYQQPAALDGRLEEVE